MSLCKPCARPVQSTIRYRFWTKYGRSGKFFAHQYNGIKADIITVAKGIGNGFPMAGVLISPMFTPVYGQLGTTFGGNHLACSAALAVLDVIEQEALVENAAQVGAYLMVDMAHIAGLVAAGLHRARFRMQMLLRQPHIRHCADREAV